MLDISLIFVTHIKHELLINSQLRWLIRLLINQLLTPNSGGANLITLPARLNNPR